jgi:ribosomal protein L3
MGGETVKLKDKQIIDMFTNNGEYIVAVKGSVPGSYNGILKLYVS